MAEMEATVEESLVAEVVMEAAEEMEAVGDASSFPAKAGITRNKLAC